MAKLTPTQPLTFTLRHKDGTESEHQIFPGESYDLPENNEYIAGLIGNGLLVEAKAPRKAEAETKPKN